MCLAVLARARGLHENDSGVNQMGELYNPYPKLPKNTRQIGERDQSVRLYLEDYVNTYLKRLFPKGGQDLRVGVLLGTSEEHDGVPYLFVDGALEMEDVAEQGEKVELTESAWKKVYQDMDRLFPKRSVLGWFKSLKLLETAWTVFCREKPADVSELRIGGRGSSLHNIRGRIL